MAKLIIYSGTPQAREFELKPGVNRIGRGEANDLQITDPSVSTHHAQITVAGGSILIQDLNSTNGTFLNHAPVTAGTLLPGLPLRLGGVDLIFLADAPAPAPAPVAARLVVSSPPPAPTRVDLKVSAPPPVSTGPAPLPLPEPTAGRPPAAAPAEATVYAEPPPGKSACKFHPKIGGQWLCRKCNELFCPLCVSVKPSSEGTLHSCRKCGATCVPVKPRLVVAKEKKVVVYSDQMLLVRSLGFGFGAALLSALIWTGLSWLFGVDVPFLFAPMAGALCGYAVKIGCQDTPGPVFSTIAAIWCVIGSVGGKFGMIAVTHLTLNTNTTYLTGGLGVLIAIFAAWKIGGGDT